MPGVGAIATALGGIAVDRGTSGQDSFENAAVALEGGEQPGRAHAAGDDPAGREVLRPGAQGQDGAARLAAITRAPVIPIGIWGSEQVWPPVGGRAERPQRHQPAEGPRPGR